MTTASEVDLKLDGHIDVCAVRYEGIAEQMRAVHARLKRIEQIGIVVAGSIIGMLLKIILHI